MEPNFVYVMRLSDRIHKIGISVDPEARARQLELLHGLSVRVIRTWPREVGDAMAIEKKAHKILAERRHFELDGREIFDVTAEVACCAVELAIALDRDAAVGMLRHLSVATNSRLADLSCLPANDEFLGYVKPSGEYDKTDQYLKMCRRGVLPEYIYDDLPAALKALRTGWTLVVETLDGLNMDRLKERGVHVEII